MYVPDFNGVVQYREQMGAKKDQKPLAGPKMPKHLITPQFLDFQVCKTIVTFEKDSRSP